MTTQPKPGRITTSPNGRPVIAGPWPSYRQFRDLPERERWVLYGHAKACRGALEDQGFLMAEGYHDFVKRVTEGAEHLMAGDWIKFELATLEKPEVCQLASLANVDMDAVVGKLLRVWGWFDQHTEEGNAPSVSKLLLDRLAGVTGFCDFMCQVGWMVEEGGVISLPRFDRHNGKTAKNRLLTAKRVANHKAANAKGNGASVSDALPREDLDVEKSKRKDIEPPLPPEGDAAGAASDRPRPKPRKSTTVTATTMTNSVTGLSQDVAEAYLVHRKAKRAPLTDLAWKGIAKTLLDAAQLGAAPDRVLSKAIERGWTGLELEWLINSGVLSSGHQGSPPHLNLDQIDHEEGLERQADGTYRIARP